MFGGINNRFKNLQYGSIKKRRKIFWITAIGVFVVVVVIWILSGTFLSLDKKPGASASFDEIRSLWSQTKEQWQKLTNDAQNALESIGSSTGMIVTSTATSSVSQPSGVSTSSTNLQ